MHLMYPWLIQGINQKTLDALVHYLLLLNTPVWLIMLGQHVVGGARKVHWGILKINPYSEILA